MIITKLMKESFGEGQMLFAETIKTALYTRDNNIFDRVDFYNDELYLEPSLFQYLNPHNENKVSLEQTLFTKTNIEKWENPVILSDKNGIIYIPDYGYLKTAHQEKEFTIQGSKLFLDKKTVAYQHIPIDYLGDTGIELCSFQIPLFDGFYKSWDTKSEKVNIVTSTDALYTKCRKHILEAFRIISEYTPEYYQYCLKSTKKIILFVNSVIPGFVTREAHGVIYLSVHEESNVAFFIDEIVHQCGHNIFNGITCQLKEHIKIDTRINLQDLVGHQNVSNTSIDGAYHGLFTVCTGIQVLYKIAENVMLDNRNKQELSGRLGIKQKRFRTWVNDLDMEAVFTEKGFTIYKQLDEPCDKIISTNPQYFDTFDFSNQPYVFSYHKFAELNEV